MEDPYEEVEIEQKAWYEIKTLPLVKMHKKTGKSAAKADSKKSRSEVEAERGVKTKQVGLEVCLMRIMKKIEASHFLGLEGKHES